MWRKSATVGNPLPLREVGLKVAKALIDWVEDLAPEFRQHVAGVSPMNEPAHLAWGTADWGNHLEVMQWYKEVGESFRASKLPEIGVKMYVQLIATAFPDFGANFLATVKEWYDGAFTHEEQQKWAVMDHHWYSAWSGEECSGR